MIKKKKSEKGIALLFAMGILSLMTVLALSLASISMEKQANSLSMSFSATAENLAASLIDRVKYQLSDFDSQETMKNSNIDFLSALYSRTGTYSTGSKSVSGEYTFDYDHIWRLTDRKLTLDTAVYAMDAMDYSNDTKQQASPTWQYIYNPIKEDIDAADNPKLLARFAYVAVAKGRPVIDFSSLFLDNGNNLLTPSTFTRRGVQLAGELDPAFIWEKLSTASTYKNLLDLTSTSPLLQDIKKKRLSDYSDIDRYITENNNADVKLEYLKTFVKAFATDSTKYPEYFTLANDDNATKYQRISLPKLTEMIAQVNDENQRQDIVDNQILKKVSEASSGKGFLNTFDQESSTSIDNSKLEYPCIPWFSRISDTKKAKQMAANFLDFFTPVFQDGKAFYPTSDQPHTNWMTSTPSYMGLKKTPYISGTGLEMAFGLTISRKDGSQEGEGASATYLYQATLSVEEWTLFTELINMYQELTSSANTEVELAASGKITLEFSLGTEKKTLELDIRKSDGGDAVVAGQSMPTGTKQRGYYEIVKNSPDPAPAVTWETIKDGENDYRASTAPQITVKLTSFTFEPKIQLNWKHPDASGYIAVDFADLTTLKYNLNTDGEDLFANTSAENSATYLTFATRAVDPRANLNLDSWGSNSGTLTNANLKIETAGATIMASLNDLLKDKDFYQDEYTDASSTVELTKAGNYYMRGTPIDLADFSADELSYIHRGTPNETLNFTKYPDTEYTSTADLSRNYDDGDLALLDQFKLTDEQYSYGKVNINLLDQENAVAISALLKNSYSSFPKNPAENDPVIEETAVKEFFDYTKADNPRKTAPYYFRRRTDIANLFKNLDAAKANKVIPKLLFLLDAEPTYLPRRVYVYGLAQILEERNAKPGKNWTETDTTRYEAGYSTLPSSDGVKVQSYRKPEESTPEYLKYNNVTDEIVAEKQVFAVLERAYTLTPYSASNKPKWNTVKVVYGD